MSNSTIPLPADEQKVWSRLANIIEYFERLGIATAVGAAGMAAIYFRETLLPRAATLPAIIGVILIFAAFALVVFSSAASVRAIFGNANKWVLGTAMVIYVVVGIVWVRAGFVLADATIHPSAPAVASTQAVQCTGTPLQEKSVPADVGSGASTPTI